MKTCSKCGKEKPLSDFGRTNFSKDGLITQCKLCKKKYRQENKDKVKEYNKKFREQNKEYFNKYAKHRYKTDDIFKLQYILRTRVYDALKSQYTIKDSKTIKLIGCSVEEAWKHLEKSFYTRSTGEEMTLDNHCKNGWHIDHIKPISSFDLTDLDQQKLCCHYTNLQALWSEDNLSKAAKLNWVK